MTLRLTIQQFLQTAKQSFLSAIKENKPDRVMIVSGNESADLDSITSSILLSYISSFSPNPTTLPTPYTQKRIFLPLINIPRDEIDLRPEVLHLATKFHFQASDLFFLDDLPTTSSSSVMDKVPWVLVDHNARTGKLLDRFGNNSITGIIDHHADEGYAKNADPRIISAAGSCCSLVTNYLKEGWGTLSETLPENIDKSLSAMAMVPVLIDTANLVSKVTQHDITAIEYLMGRNTEVDRDQLYDEFKTAKGAIDDFPMRDLLRKDYKEWEEDNGVRLGIASIGRSLEWIVQRDGQEFINAVDKWCEERKLEVIGIVCNNGAKRGEDYKRFVLVRGVSDRSKDVAGAFETQGKEELALKKLEFEVEVGGATWSWEQGNLEKSRKEIAPLLRGICAGL